MLTSNNVRGEHILWLTPMVYTCLASYTAPVQIVVFYFNANYYLLSFLSTTMIFIAIMAIPFVLHKHFRENSTRSISISWMHILSSAIIMVGILMIYTYTPPIDLEWKSNPIMRPELARWHFFNEFAIVLFQVFVLIQIAYSIYGFHKLYKQKRNQSNENDDHYLFQTNKLMANNA